MTTTAPQEGTVGQRIWIVQGGERSEGVGVLHDGERALVFSDDQYSEAFAAFLNMVKERIRTGAMYSYPGEIGHMAHAHVVAQGGGDCDDYYSDIVELRPYD